MQTHSINGTIVYLEASPEAYPLLLQNFLKSPSPLIWRGIVPPKNETALADGYTQLIQHRLALYEQFAQITIPYSVHRQPDFTAQELLNYIGY